MLLGNNAVKPRLAVDNTAQGDNQINQSLKAILTREGIIKRHKRGEYIARNDSRSDKVFFVESGFVAVTCVSAGGKRQVLDFEGAGSVLVPFSHSNSNGDYSIEVLSDTTSYMMSLSSFRRAIAEDSIAVGELTLLSEDRLNRAYEALTNIGCQQGRDRVRCLLARLVHRLCAHEPGPIKTVPIRQVDLADAAGVTTVYVNQILKKLEASEVISLHKGSIDVLDLDKLSEDCPL